MPALLLLTGPSAGLRFEVLSEATLGRSPSCDISLQDGRVSRRHARVWREGAHAKLADLGSRNGTLVNGERIEGETVLRQGDRVQVGETTVLVEPPSRAALADRETGEMALVPVEDALPPEGPEAAFCAAGVALLSATSQAMVLRRAAEEARRMLAAERTAALLGGAEGLLTAAVVGAGTVEVPRAMARAALERREMSRGADAACAPLVAPGGAAFGVLYVERQAPPPGLADQRALAALGRLAGAAFTALGARVGVEAGDLQLVGTSRAFRGTVEQARRAAAGDRPVVVHGEPGTGKALLARYVHARSTRALGPLVTVECRHPLRQLEAELLGRPSTPGAPPRPSALLRADGGSLLLRAVEQLPRELAGHLASWLERGCAPVPGGGEEPVVVRLLATAPVPAGLLSAHGPGGAELARLLEGDEVEVQPLRERRGDIPALFALFAQEASRPLRRDPPRLSPEARRMLGEYGWPHNARELRLVAERLALLHAGGEVPALHLPPPLQEGGATPAPRTLAERVQRLEREAVEEALREAGGKKIRAAALLGISRPTLDKKIEEYGVAVERVRRAR
jgi:DNA-binding NtrC family response regulator